VCIWCNVDARCSLTLVELECSFRDKKINKMISLSVCVCLSVLLPLGTGILHLITSVTDC